MTDRNWLWYDKDFFVILGHFCPFSPLTIWEIKILRLKKTVSAFWVVKLNCFAVYNSKAIKISPNQQAGLLTFLFTEDSLKIKKCLELVSRPHFPYNFLIKKVILKCYINWPNFITRLCLLPKLLNKMCFVFHA